MGAGFSGLETDHRKMGNARDDPAALKMKPGLGDLPESCVALVLAGLEPTEICRMARVNRTFCRASRSDYVWEKKLPENYGILVRKLFDVCADGLRRKEIYARLCTPNCFGGTTKEVWLEKSSGGVCAAISWKGLKITGIDDRRYWSHISSDESRFNSIAYLKQTWWLEVEGNLEFEFPAGTYSLFFRLHLGRASKKVGRRGVCEFDRVHGWDTKPVQFKLSSSSAVPPVDGGNYATSQFYLKEPGKWTHYHAGEFVVENSSVPTRLKFSMTQIDCTHTKGGLCLDSVFIYPSKLKEKLQKF